MKKIVDNLIEIIHSACFGSDTNKVIVNTRIAIGKTNWSINPTDILQLRVQENSLPRNEVIHPRRGHDNIIRKPVYSPG